MDLLEGGLKLVCLAMTFADSVGMLGGRHILRVRGARARARACLFNEQALYIYYGFTLTFSIWVHSGTHL